MRQIRWLGRLLGIDASNARTRRQRLALGLDLQTHRDAQERFKRSDHRERGRAIAGLARRLTGWTALLACGTLAGLWGRPFIVAIDFTLQPLIG